MAWKYSKEGFPNKRALLDEVSRLIDGTPNFAPIAHFIVDDKTNLVIAMNIGGEKAEANFREIVDHEGATEVDAPFVLAISIGRTA